MRAHLSNLAMQLWGFDIPVGTMAFYSGITLASVLPVGADKWALIGSVSTVLIAKAASYLTNRVNRTADNEAARMARDERRDENLIKLVVHSIDQKRVEKHEVMEALNLTLGTLQELKRGAVKIEDVDVAAIKQQVLGRTKPIVTEYAPEAKTGE